jgi:hypothetical protein
VVPQGLDVSTIREYIINRKVSFGYKIDNYREIAKKIQYTGIASFGPDPSGQSMQRVEWHFGKRYSEFEKLKKQIYKSFPSNFDFKSAPPFPSGTGTSIRTSGSSRGAAVINERMAKLGPWVEWLRESITTFDTNDSPAIEILVAFLSDGFGERTAQGPAPAPLPLAQQPSAVESYAVTAAADSVAPAASSSQGWTTEEEAAHAVAQPGFSEALLGASE